MITADVLRKLRDCPLDLPEDMSAAKTSYVAYTVGIEPEQVTPFQHPIFRDFKGFIVTQHGPYYGTLIIADIPHNIVIQGYPELGELDLEAVKDKHLYCERFNSGVVVSATFHENLKSTSLGIQGLLLRSNSEYVLQDDLPFKKALELHVTAGKLAAMLNDINMTMFFELSKEGVQVIDVAGNRDFIFQNRFRKVSLCEKYGLPVNGCDNEFQASGFSVEGKLRGMKERAAANNLSGYLVKCYLPDEFIVGKLTAMKVIQ